MDEKLPMALCFLLALVVGYFAGRMMGILDRNK
jgi:hypothetical protein